jgi:hypothetical protein
MSWDEAWSVRALPPRVLLGEGRMTITRSVAGALVLAAVGAPCFAQSGDPYAPSTRSAVIPSVYPAEADPASAPPQPVSAGMPPGRPPAAAMQPVRPFSAPPTTVLDRISTAVQPIAAEQSDPLGTLTGQPVAEVPGPVLPTGAYPSPYFTDGPGCCGPLGRHGRVGYEIYSYTGPTWAIGEGEFTRRLQTGWMVGGGGRSLFFDPSHTTAWVADVGLSYQYNRGEEDDPVRTDVRQPPLRNQFTGELTVRPDILTEVRVRALHRTNFNFGVGHDWWYRGPGSVGLEDCTNMRAGLLLGGRWGTAHVDLEPVATPGGYARRQKVTHGIFLAAHGTCEIPMGTWILFAGLRAEWAYDWTNIVPPMNGNMHSLNLLLHSGIRF